jgi:MSHA type pilus biogenesis protein MshL
VGKKFLFVCGLLSVLSACDLIHHREFHDPYLKLQKKDYENITSPPQHQKNIPPFLPKPPSPLKTPILTPAMRKNISISLHGAVFLKDVLMELGRQADVGIAVSPQISSEKIELLYRSYRIPFIDVIKDICSLTQLRFHIHGNRILIEPDEPYLKTYNVHFLNYTRKSENRMSVSTDVFAPLESQAHTDNGSDSVLLGMSHIDFWVELEQNLKMILNTERTPPSKGPPTYTLHKQGGLVTILGTARQHEQIYDYFRKLKEGTSSQVIIEAKIIEVTLNNEFKSGINWSQLGGDVHVIAPLASVKPHSSLHSPDIFTFSVDHEKFSAVLNLVKKFGTVRTLSNPRLTVMNNQPAMLKVATNEVFFHLEFERYFQSEGKPDVENISSDALTVPIGLVMIVQPSVNLQTGEITMTLRPTISRVQKEVEDPAVAIKSNQKVKSTVPVVQVRELDSVLKMKSGQVLVMGGLMEDRSINTTASVPVIDSIPFIGELAKGKDDDRKITELVIFLTAHITEDPFILEADEHFYNVYTEDPRPLRF